MILLYIADEGFSINDGEYYFTRPNYINSQQFGKYFDKIIFLARKSKYIEGSIKIPNKSEVFLFKKLDFFGLKKFLKEHKDEYDVALLRNGMNGCISVNTLRKLGKQVISYLGYDALSYKLSQRNVFSFVEGIIWYFLEKNKMSKGTYAHYCSDYLVKKYPPKVPYLVCPNVEIGTDDEILVERKKTIIDKDKQIIVGLIGTLNSNKGIDTAIKSINLLPMNYTLEIVGGGNNEKYVKLANKLNVQERVKFLGYFPKKEAIDEWLRKVDIYIQPSLSEGIPRSAIEAMAAACPLIVSNKIGASSWIDEEWHIKPRKYKELSEKILLMGSSENIRIQQSLKNFETAKRFSPEIREEKMDYYYRFFKENMGKKDEYQKMEK